MGSASPQSNDRNAFSSGTMNTEHLRLLEHHAKQAHQHCTTEIQVLSARLSFTKHGTLKLVGNLSPGSSSVQYNASGSVSRTAAAVPPCTVHLSSCPAVLSHHQGQPTTLHGQLHLPGSAPPHTEHMWMQIPQGNFMAGFPLL